ncbi:hypothetical protein RHMOL_Rhmol07G0100900 [Rhododendron molle]|uniref:Uncharacterized protein n=1 Tax=Rhododendron molle TaxID=49168 RepID=A0ACC0MZ95_RHOML|nr:hypothetical protein RHMOL_Rhmol07G0100900 [Rhododendron molle]
MATWVILDFGLVLCSTVLHIYKPSDCASDDSDLISATNNREPFIAEMRSEPVGYTIRRLRGAQHGDKHPIMHIIGA